MAAKLPNTNFRTTRTIEIEGYQIPRDSLVVMKDDYVSVYMHGNEYYFDIDEFMAKGPLLLEDDELQAVSKGTKDNPEDGQRFVFTKRCYVEMTEIQAGSLAIYNLAMDEFEIYGPGAVKFKRAVSRSIAKMCRSLVPEHQAQGFRIPTPPVVKKQVPVPITPPKEEVQDLKVEPDCKIDLTKTDVFDDYLIDNKTVEDTLKVLRTLILVAGKNNAELEKLVLIEAHKAISKFVKEAKDAEVKEKTVKLLKERVTRAKVTELQKARKKLHEIQKAGPKRKGAKHGSNPGTQTSSSSEEEGGAVWDD